MDKKLRVTFAIFVIIVAITTASIFFVRTCCILPFIYTAERITLSPDGHGTVTCHSTDDISAIKRNDIDAPIFMFPFVLCDELHGNTNLEFIDLPKEIDIDGEVGVRYSSSATLSDKTNRITLDDKELTHLVWIEKNDFFLILREETFSVDTNGSSEDQRCEPKATERYTAMTLYKHEGDDPMKWEPYRFNQLNRENYHLLNWERVPKHNGFLFLWENHAENRNELQLFNTDTLEVVSSLPLPYQNDKICCLRASSDEKIVAVFGCTKVELFSIPDFKLLKKCTLSYPIDESHPILSVSCDGRLIAYGRGKVFVYDFDTGYNEVLDRLHSGKILLHDFSKESVNAVPYWRGQYDIESLKFKGATHILAGLTWHNEYYEWDVEQRKRLIRPKRVTGE